MSMILLEARNRILAEAVANAINGDGKRDMMDVRLCDMDDVSYHVTVPPEGDKLEVSINAPCYDFIDEKGSKAALQEAFGDKLKDEPEASHHATVCVNFADLGDQKEKDKLIDNLGLIKTILIGGVFKHYFQMLEKKEAGDPFAFDLRNDTKLYMFPGKDRCTIVFELDFQLKVDAVIAQIFLQEFQDARRRLGAAPPCMFNQNPPAELAKFDITENTWSKPEGMRGYLSFAILPSHIASGKMDGVIEVLQSFRNYLQYHIKCSKSYFHSRMRHQVRELIKVLNRAKYPDPDKIKRKADGTPFNG